MAGGNVQMSSIKCYWWKQEIYEYTRFTKTMEQNRNDDL